jgi:putative PIN family toxin of toxin-antitoxin system
LLTDVSCSHSKPAKVEIGLEVGRILDKFDNQKATEAPTYSNTRKTLEFSLENEVICDILCAIMKALLDTNILVAALYSKRGASYQLLKAALSGLLSIAVSPLVAWEYEGVLHRKIEEGFLKISKEDCATILSALFSMATVVWTPLQVRPVLSDPSDDKILECAISCDCTHIVTFNKRHFPAKLTAPWGISVMTAGEFLLHWRDKS